MLALLLQGAGTVLTSAPAGAATTTTAFTPVADATVYSKDPTVNFGFRATLVADRSPKTKSFLRFEVAGLTSPPSSARLRLWVTNKSSNGPEVRPVTSSWEEATVAYDTRPSVGSKVDDANKVPKDRWLEYDVSLLVGGNGTVEMALVGDSSDGTDVASREDGTAAHRPQLVVETVGTGPPPPPPSGSAFSFGLVGDTGYTASSVEKFLSVRDDMNRAGLAFTVHVGDIKAGSDPCPDRVYSENLERFDGFHHPLVYTPGDNEWRDCPDKEDRLGHLRQVFFADELSMGTPPMTLQRQSVEFPENALWHHDPITFMTLHTVGSDNNQKGSEFESRNAANVAWMKAAFDAARARDSAGVVILSHANPGFPPDATSRASKDGFESYLEVLRSEVKDWGRPVLYVHGDTHTFRVDQPRILGSRRTNFTRVEVYGPSDEHWVRVDVDSSGPDLFSVAGR